MRRNLTLIALAAGLSGPPTFVMASSLELRVGGFLPRASRSLFSDVTQLYTVDKEDFRGVTGGIEFNFVPVPNLEVGLSVDGFERSIDTSYRDFVRMDGSEIYQSLSLEVVPIGLSLRLIPTRRGVRVAPYVAVGADLFYWRYEQSGDFIDFFSPGQEILPDTFIADGIEPGFHVAAGVRVPISYDFSVTAEVRHQWAVARMGDDFVANAPGLENDLDLTGAAVTIGFNLRF